MDEYQRKRLDQRLEYLSTERARIWRQLERDFDVDEDHMWRCKKFQELAEIEMELHIIDRVTSRIIWGGLERDG